LQELAEDAVQSLRAETLPVVWSHGDFWPGNLLGTAEGERLTGVVDWKFADQHGMPLLDLLQLLLRTKGLASGKGFTGELVTRLVARRFEEDEQPLIKEYCMQVGVSERATWPLVFMGWLDWVYHRTSVNGYMPSWRRQEITGFLEAAREIASAMISVGTRSPQRRSR
jgi:thiamine kinase-like enzyme